jgi:hypothetical protein
MELPVRDLSRAVSLFEFDTFTCARILSGTFSTCGNREALPPNRTLGSWLLGGPPRGEKAAQRRATGNPIPSSLRTASSFASGFSEILKKIN